MQSSKEKLPNKSDFLTSAARNNFINFCQVIDPNYEANWHHQVIAEKLEHAIEMAEQDKPYRLILEMPPRHGKSHTATTLFPTYALGKHPEWPFIITSYSADLAQSFGMKARDIIQTNPNYPAIFPKTRIRKDSKAKDKWITTNGGSYSSVGVGGAITGFGAKIAIIDDPLKNREEADSQSLRQKIYEWYTSTLYTRLEGSGVIIIIMTRWHLDDLVGRVLNESGDNKEEQSLTDEWDVVRFPAIAEHDEEHRKEGEALWPNKFPKPTLNNIKENITVHDWASLYQQNPILSENQEFRQEMFKTFEEEDIQPQYLRYTTTVDPATGQAKGDNTVITTVGKQADGPNWYVVEETAGKFDPGQTADIIFRHQNQYRSEVYIETVAYQKMLKWYIIEEQKRRMAYFTVHELKRNTRTAKEQRIRGLLPLFNAGVIFLRPSQRDLRREFLQFPKGRHDDRIDNLASQLEAVENTGSFQHAKVFKKKMSGYFQKR